MLMRFLPYLGGILFVLLLGFLSVLVYRYATRNDRLAPKRTLQRQIERLEIEKAMADEFMEELVRTAQASQTTEPLLADSIIRSVSAHKRAQKELHK